MSKSGHRHRRRRRADTAIQRSTRDERSLLDRVLETPHLAHVIPRLTPDVLHQVIRSCGLEDCGELVALATPEQLTRVFDLDLWRADQPGRDEQFDADRFGVWVEVLMESGADVAARKLAEMDVHLVVAALAQHVRVCDRAAMLLSTMDGEEVELISVGEELTCDVGGYLVAARRSGSWNAIVDALAALAAENRQYFHRLMRGCVSLSNSTPESDGLDDLLTDREQTMFDLAFDRERRRDTQGYVTPAQARAFLQMSRQHRTAGDATQSSNPVARAYFRAIEWTTPADANSAAKRLPEASGETLSSEESADATAAFVDALLEAGIVPQPPRALLDSGQSEDASRLARIRTHMRFAYERDHAAYSIRSQELGYLANTIVAGCSIQARPFTPKEASDAVAAVCNLGLENWDSSAGSAALPLADDFLVDHDLVSVFQVGWTVLHEQVCVYTAERLIETLARMRCEDREIRSGLDMLRIEMRKHLRAGTPWLARDYLDVIASLDMPAWAALLGLIDECPVMHAALAASRDARTLAVSPTSFEFISENSDIASVRAFVHALPEMLRG